MNLLISILCLIFFAIVLLLVVLNTGLTDVHLFFRSFERVPVAVVMVASLLTGITFAAFIGVLDGIRIRLQNRRLRREVAQLEEEIGALRNLPARDEPDGPEENPPPAGSPRW